LTLPYRLLLSVWVSPSAEHTLRKGRRPRCDAGMRLSRPWNSAMPRSSTPMSSSDQRVDDHSARASRMSRYLKRRRGACYAGACARARDHHASRCHMERGHDERGTPPTGDPHRGEDPTGPTTGGEGHTGDGLTLNPRSRYLRGGGVYNIYICVCVC